MTMQNDPGALAGAAGADGGLVARQQQRSHTTYPALEPTKPLRRTLIQAPWVWAVR